MGRLMNYPIKKITRHKTVNQGNDGGVVAAVGNLKKIINMDLSISASASADVLIEAVDMALLQAMGVERKISSLQQKIAEMETLALSDSLTKALNRRGLEMELARVLAAAERYDETGVLVFIDLDGFKPINDTYGHAAGDLVLQKVVDLLKANIRPTDSVGRLGGDEFAVILSRTGWENGLARAEMLERTINNAIVHWQRTPIALRASFGFQRFGPKTDADELMRMADAAMYRAKRARAELAKIIAAEAENEERQSPIINKNIESDENKYSVSVSMQSITHT